MSDSMHPQRAQALLGDSSQPPEVSSLPPGVSPPPGFGGVQLVPAQAPPVQSPPTQQPAEQDQPAGKVSSPPHPSDAAHVPLQQGLLQAPPGYGHPPFQGPPFGPPGGHMVPPFPHHPHHPPHFPPHMPHLPQGIPFHPGMAPPGFQPGFPGAPHFPGPFGPGGFPPRPGMQFPPQAPFAQPPFAPHVPPTMSPALSVPPAAAAPRAEGKAPQIQMITSPQLNRSGIPVEVEGQTIATPQPLPGDNQPLQFKSNAAQSNEEEEGCWTETTSDEGSVYYYNTKTMETTWDVPKGYKVKSKPKPVSWETIGDGTWKKVILDNDQHYYFNTKTKASVWTVPPEVQAILDEQEREREKEKESEQNNDNDGDIEEREAKKQKTENEESTTTPEEDAAAAEAAAAAAKISEEEHKKNVEIFREMLREYKIAPFTKWEKELPKFVGDPRFQLLPRHSERRAVFDQFVRHRLEEEKREKKERIKAAQESFRKMLSEFETKFHEAVENSNFSIFSISEFENIVKDDERWKNVDQKDREPLFNEFLVPFKQEIEEKKKDELEKAKADFVELLKENSVNTGAKWDRTKVKIDRDPRYKHPLLQTADKETIFKDYLSSLEADSAKRKKREREEASKRDREREVRELRERGNRELDKRREQLKREEEEANYRALLSEKIKEPNMSWKEAIKLIDSDPRFRAHHLLRDDKDRMFEDHMKSLLEKRIKDFKSLLSETIFDISIDWKHAKDLLRDDRRYSRLPSERERETTFDKYIQEIRKRARESFRELLRETKTITASTIMDSKEFEQIKESIRPDKRYAAWNDEKSERDKMFKEHILELQREQAARPTKKLVVVDEET